MDLDKLGSTVQKLLNAPESDRKNLGDKLHSLGLKDAGGKLATLLIEIINPQVG